jgi:phosphoglycolate phosphatase-like HAD superfamily hydrolase
VSADGARAGASLLLFDVDGTLVWRATEAHRDALHDALREIHGIDPAAVRTSIEFAGRTDGEISRAILLAAGVSARRIDERGEQVREACCARYAQLVGDDLSEFVLPGVPELLEWLSAPESRARLALLTGNFEAVARLKLARAGIGSFFEHGQGAFGSDAEDRVSLPAIARRRAGTVGVPFPRERTIVIGDTPRDIACARADEVRCVTVATGPCGIDELGAADAVARDAFELRERLRELL